MKEQKYAWKLENDEKVKMFSIHYLPFSTSNPWCNNRLHSIMHTCNEHLQLVHGYLIPFHSIDAHHLLFLLWPVVVAQKIFDYSPKVLFEMVDSV